MSILIDHDGTYLFRSFTGKNGTWTIVGTKTQSNHRNAMLCIDTFKSEKGEYIDMKREKVRDMNLKGHIVPVPSSEIKASVDNGKTKRRAV